MPMPQRMPMRQPEAPPVAMPMPQPAAPPCGAGPLPPKSSDAVVSPDSWHSDAADSSFDEPDGSDIASLHPELDRAGPSPDGELEPEVAHRPGAAAARATPDDQPVLDVACHPEASGTASVAKTKAFVTIVPRRKCSQPSLPPPAGTPAHEASKSAIPPKHRPPAAAPPPNPPTAQQTHAALVDLVKDWQRQGGRHQNAWRLFALSSGTTTFDPCRHDAGMLAAFLRMTRDPSAEAGTLVWDSLRPTGSLMMIKGCGKGKGEQVPVPEPPKSKPRLRTPPRRSRPPSAGHHTSQSSADSGETWGARPPEGRRDAGGAQRTRASLGETGEAWGAWNPEGRRDDGDEQRRRQSPDEMDEAWGDWTPDGRRDVCHTRRTMQSPGESPDDDDENWGDWTPGGRRAW